MVINCYQNVYDAHVSAVQPEFVSASTMAADPAKCWRVQLHLPGVGQYQTALPVAPHHSYTLPMLGKQATWIAKTNKLRVTIYHPAMTDPSG